MANYDYTLKIGANADAVFEEIAKKYSNAQKHVDGDEIEIKFNCDDSSIAELIEEIQKLNPKIGTDIKLNFDQAEMRKQLTRLNNYINKSMDASSISKELQEELSEGLNLKRIKDLDFKKFLRDNLGPEKSSVTKNVAHDYIMGLYKDINKLDFSRTDITYTQILETISKYQELIAYSEKATGLYPNLKFPDFSAELKNLFKDSSEYIERNKDNLKISLIDSYKDEMKKFKEIVKGLGLKSDMFPSVEVDIVPDIDPVEFSKDIQKKLNGQFVEIDVKPKIDDIDNFSKELSEKLKDAKVDVNVDASVSSVSTNNNSSASRNSNKSPKLLYHWGNFNSENAGKTKAENFASMISSFIAGSRDKATNAPWGSFGSGMYVVSNPANFSDIDFSELTEKDLLKQFMAIDVSKLNLYETKTTERAQELYDFLTKYQQFVISLGSGYDFEGTFNPDDFSIESLYADLKKVFGNINMEFEEFESYVEEMLDLVETAGIKDDGTMSPKATLKVGQDNFSTRLLKKLGYDGVNNEGTEFDSLMHGSVIFDPPADAVIIKWKELGEAIAYANEQREKIGHKTIPEEAVSTPAETQTSDAATTRDVVQRKIIEDDSKPVGINISPDFSPKDFVDEIKKQLSGLSVSIDINAVLGGIFTDSSSNYANVIGKWNEADKIMKSAGKTEDIKDRLAERGAFLNSKSGYISNSYVTDKIDEFSTKLRSKLYDTVDQEVDSLLHSHPQGNLAAFSVEDLEALKSWKNKTNDKITKSYLKSYSQVASLDFSNISDGILDQIISEYREEIKRIDGLDLKEKLKYKPENGDISDAVNIMYQNALTEIFHKRGLDSAFSTFSIDDFIDQNKFRGSNGIEVSVNTEKIRNDIEEAINNATGTPDVKIDTDEISSQIENSINNALRKSKTNDVDNNGDSSSNNSYSFVLEDFIEEIKRKIAESGEFIEIDVKPFVNAEEFISDIEKALQGRNIDIGVDFDSAKNAAKTTQSDIVETMRLWNEADKWMKASGAEVRERAAYANLNDGFITNAFSVDETDSVNGGLLYRIEHSANKNIDTSIHSHPETYAAFSRADMRSSLLEFSSGITKHILKTFNEIAVLDLNKIAKSDHKKFVDAYSDNVEKYDFWKSSEAKDVKMMPASTHLKTMRSRFDMDDYEIINLYKTRLIEKVEDAIDFSDDLELSPLKDKISSILASRLMEELINSGDNFSARNINKPLQKIIRNLKNEDLFKYDQDHDFNSLADNFKIESNILFKELYDDAFQKGLQNIMFSTVSELGLNPDVFEVYSYDKFEQRYGKISRSSEASDKEDYNVPIKIDTTKIRQEIEAEFSGNPLEIPVKPDSTYFISELQGDINEYQGHVEVPVKPDITDFFDEMRKSVSGENAVKIKISDDPADSDSLINKLAQLKRLGEQFSLDFSSGQFGNLELSDGSNLQEYITLLRSLRDEDLIRIGFDIEGLEKFRNIFNEYDSISGQYQFFTNTGDDYSNLEDEMGSTLLRLRDIHELISKIDLRNTLSFGADESGELGRLDNKLTETTNKIDDKTAAFEREGQIVSGIVQGEVTDLSALDGWIDMLIRDINTLTDAIISLPKIDLNTGNLDTSSISIGFIAEIDQLKKVLNDFNFDNLKSIADAIDSLKVNNSAGENLQKFSNAFLTFKSNLNNFSSGSKEVLSFINDLLSKVDELSKLSNILTEIKRQNISSMKDIADSVDKTINDASTPDTNIEKEQKKVAEAKKEHRKLISDMKKYYSILDKQSRGKSLSATEELFKKRSFEKVENSIKQIKELDSATEELTETQKNFKEAYEDTQAAYRDSYINDINSQLDKLRESDNSVLYKKELDEINNSFEKLQAIELDDFFNADATKIKEEIESVIRLLKTSKNYELADSVRVDRLDTRIANWLNNNSAAAKKFGDELNEIRKQLKDGLPVSEVNRLEAAFNDVTKRAGEANKLGRSFGEGLAKRFESLGQYLLSFASFYDVLEVLREGFRIIRGIDTAQTELIKVADASGTRLSQSFETSIETAEDLKSSISDAISAAADWSRSGYDIGAAEELAEASILYKNVGDGISIDEANASLISTLRGFKLEASDAMSIVDKFNEVANNMPIDSAGIGEALQRSASSFNAANTDLSESIALIVGSNSVLQDPTRVGNMWKTVSARIRGAKLELEEAGEDTEGMVESTSQLRGLIEGMTGFDIMVDDSTFKNMKDIIVGIGKEWKNLSDVEQAGLLEKLAGKTQANALAAALENYELIEEAYQIAENSEGSALREQEAWEKSLDAKIQGFITALEKLAVTAVDSGLLGEFIDAGTTLINVFTELIDLAGVLTPLLGTIGGILATKNGFGKQIVVYNAPFYKAA